MKGNKLNFIVYIISLFQLVSNGYKNILDYSHSIKSPLKIQAGSLSSKGAIIPFSYGRLKICEPKKNFNQVDTLAEILTGEKVFETSYEVSTGVNSFCKSLCLNEITNKTRNLFKALIRRKYFINWYLDKLPAGLIESNELTDKKTINYFTGVPLGYEENNTFYVYNHLQFYIVLGEAKTRIINMMDESRETKYNVVGFNILPMSIKHNETESLCSKKGLEDLISNYKLKPQPLDDKSILFTYDTIFEYSDLTMASRWDHYKPSNKSIHWIGITLSQIIVIICSLIIGFLLNRAITKDIDSYNYRIVRMDVADEFNWKDLSGDVFRPPTYNAMLLSSMIGTGIQLFFMLSMTLCLGTFGFLKPEHRENMLNIGIIFFCLMGLPGGYISSKLYRFFGGMNWFLNTLLTAVLYPGTFLFGYNVVNLILTIERSSAAVKVLDIFSLFILWIFCTFPLILIGSFFGVKRKMISVPYEPNPIPTIIPPKPWYMHYRVISLITGLIGFGTIFIELSYVMAALWKHQIYFLVTFLWISFIFFIIITSELSFLVVYWNLCKGDYNWWWKSFFVGGSPVLYFMAYSIYYFFSLKIKRFSAMTVYFGIMSLVSSMALFVCGSVSTIFTFWFLKFIYSRAKMY